MATILASMLVMLGKPWLERFLCIGCLFLIRTGKHEIRCIVHQQAGRQPISFSSLFAATNDMECYDGSECLLLNICIQLMYKGRKKNQSLFLPVLSRIFIHVISCLCSFAFSSFISLSFHWFFLRGSTFRLFRFISSSFFLLLHAMIRFEKYSGRRYYLFLLFHRSSGGISEFVFKR